MVEEHELEPEESSDHWTVAETILARLLVRKWLADRAEAENKGAGNGS